MVKHDILRMRINKTGSNDRRRLRPYFFSINQEKEQRSRFGDYGSNGCSFDAHFRKPEVSEYQGIVQHHIGQRHNHCIDGEHLGAGDSEVECPEHHVDK